MNKFDIDDKDLAMIGVVVLAFPVIMAAVITKQIEAGVTVFGIAATALGSLATGRKNGARPEPEPATEPETEKPIDNALE